MKQTNFLFRAAVVFALAAGCTVYGTANATQADYHAAVADAKKQLDSAENANFAWRDSGKILEKAATAAKTGDYSTAASLANQAKHQAELALIQAKEQVNAGPR